MWSLPQNCCNTQRIVQQAGCPRFRSGCHVSPVRCSSRHQQAPAGRQTPVVQETRQEHHLQRLALLCLAAGVELPAVAASEFQPTGFSKESYYVTLGLFLLSLPGKHLSKHAHRQSPGAHALHRAWMSLCAASSATLHCIHAGRQICCMHPLDMLHSMHFGISRATLVGCFDVDSAVCSRQLLAPGVHCPCPATWVLVLP